MHTMRCIIYARLSEDETGEAENVDIQIEEATDFAEEQGWQVVATLDDNDKSAYRPNVKRPGYDKVLQLVRDGAVDVILVTEMSRLNRALWNSIDLFRLAESTPLCRIATTDGGGYDLSTSSGVHNAITAAMDAEKESMRNSERRKRKAKKHAREGKHVGGPRPFGYIYHPAVKERIGGKWRIVEPARSELNEPEAEAIRQIVARLLDRTTSLRSQSNWLNGEGFRTTLGNRWHPSTLRRVLTNKRIIGIRVHSSGEYPAQWPKIIEPEQFDELQLLLNAEKRFSETRTNARDYLLTGFIHCGREDCGRALIGFGRTTNGDLERRYYCVKATPSGITRGCGKLGRLADPVELLVTEAVLYRYEADGIATALAKSDAGEMQTLIRQHQNEKLKLDDLITDYATGLLNREQLAQAKAIVEDALETTRRKMAQLDSGRALASIPLGQSIREKWNANDDLAWRRGLIRLLVDRVILHPGYPGSHVWPDEDAQQRFPGLKSDRTWHFDPTHVEIVWKV
jgi:site-specific DNA recombinase